MSSDHFVVKVTAEDWKMQQSDLRSRLSDKDSHMQHLKEYHSHQLAQAKTEAERERSISARLAAENKMLRFLMNNRSEVSRFAKLHLRKDKLRTLNVEYLKDKLLEEADSLVDEIDPFLFPTRNVRPRTGEGAIVQQLDDEGSESRDFVSRASETWFR